MGAGRPGREALTCGEDLIGMWWVSSGDAPGLPGAPRRRSHLAVEVGEASQRNVADGTFQNWLQRYSTGSSYKVTSRLLPARRRVSVSSL